MYPNNANNINVTPVTYNIISWDVIEMIILIDVIK